jgi:NitT/TauT family transport system ATP-binding protein
MTDRIDRDGDDAAMNVRLPGRAPGRVTVRGLALELGGGRRGGAASVEVVRDLDLDVAPGELVCLLGPSGCGKSSLLSALAGFLRSSRGTIEVDGRLVTGPEPELGMVFQQTSLLPWRSIEENVAFGLKMRGAPARARRAAAREFLGLVGLRGFERHYPAQLSGGMQQRAEIARALINQPRVIFMDEPFAALDAQTRFMMQELLLGVWARVGTTVVFVTHDIEEALFLGDRIFVMTGCPGRIRETVTVPFPRPRAPELTTAPPFVALKRHCLDLVREETLRSIAAPADAAVARRSAADDPQPSPGRGRPRLAYSADRAVTTLPEAPAQALKRDVSL